MHECKFLLHGANLLEMFTRIKVFMSQLERRKGTQHSTMTPRIMGLIVTLSINDTHNINDIRNINDTQH